MLPWELWTLFGTLQSTERIGLQVHHVLLPATNSVLWTKNIDSSNWQRKCVWRHDSSWIGLLKCAAQTASLRDGKQTNLTAAQGKRSQDRVYVEKEIMK